jgi:MoaA/NifB/PqqE/SkfB family radical SAM enzyme
MFAGAGISTPQVPLASEIVTELRRAHHGDIPQSPSSFDDYSNVLGKVYTSREDRRQYFENLILGKPLSPAALRLAYLLASPKCIKTLITPNFDDFVERALDLFGVRCHVYERPESLQVAKLDSDEPQVCHIHGAFRDYDIANLRGEVRADQGHPLVDVLLRLLHARSCIVLGYAGWPEDIFMTALKRRLWKKRGREPIALPRVLYWFCHNHEEPSRLPSWLQNHGDVTFVVADESDPSKRLDAADVLQRLIDALRLPVPALSVDPLGAFVRNLRESLHDEKKDSEWNKLYIFSQRLRGLYPNRAALGRYFHPVQIMDKAALGSEIIIAGRTLKGWATCSQEMIWFGKSRQLSFKLLLSTETAAADLDEKQQDEVEQDRKQAVARFQHVRKQLRHQCELRETPHLIVDGVTLAEVKESLLDATQGTTSADTRLICEFDINAAPGPDKPTLVLACTCGVSLAERGAKAEASTKPDVSCTTHGLLHRTLRLFDKAHPLLPEDASGIQSTLWLAEEGTPARKNSPQGYVQHARRIFEALGRGRPDDLPPPLCVQANVWSKCDTQCTMCDRWNHPSTQQNLSLADWQKVFMTLSRAAQESRIQTTAVISGGEPLAFPQIDELLGCVREEARMRIGLLTSGLIEGKDDERRRRVRNAVKNHVDWVAISVDGTEDSDRQIRGLIPGKVVGNRWTNLREFCEELRGGPKVSATVTLQKKNIGVDHSDICAFIHDLGIDTVNFKFATGNHDSLGQHAPFLIEEGELNRFFKALCSEPIANEPNNNLSYLRRCHAAGIFKTEDIALGAPVRSFYVTEPMQCFTPFLSCLIDPTGRVYPCCHLYRDNHSSSPKSSAIREAHCMGELRPDFDLLRIWRGDRYAQERERLSVIRPQAPSSPSDVDFSPCGECTRFVQHNHTLNRLSQIFQRNPAQFAEWCHQVSPTESSSSPVWF